MAYKLHPERPPAQEIARVAAEEIDKAASELGEPAGNRDEAIHDVRKRLKKLRGLLRLVRTSDAALYRSQNARFRDAAKRLSSVRDRAALVEALDALGERFGTDPASAPLASLRLVLERRRQAAVEAGSSLPDTIAEVLGTLREARAQWDGWEAHQGRSAARRSLLDGIEANYRRARAGLQHARRDGDAESFHELRKRAKYHAMHLKLLSPAWPDMIERVRGAADEVADDLGRDHDYAVLRAEIAAAPDAYGSPGELEAVTALVDTYQDELRASAVQACARLFAERPKAFRRRIESYLDVAKPGSAGDAPAGWSAVDKQARSSP